MPYFIIHHLRLIKSITYAFYGSWPRDGRKVRRYSWPGDLRQHASTSGPDMRQTLRFHALSGMVGGKSWGLYNRVRECDLRWEGGGINR